TADVIPQQMMEVAAGVKTRQRTVSGKVFPVDRRAAECLTGTPHHHHHRKARAYPRHVLSASLLRCVRNSKQTVEAAGVKALHRCGDGQKLATVAAALDLAAGHRELLDVPGGIGGKFEFAQHLPRQRAARTKSLLFGAMVEIEQADNQYLIFIVREKQIIETQNRLKPDQYRQQMIAPVHHLVLRKKNGFDNGAVTLENMLFDQRRLEPDRGTIGFLHNQLEVSVVDAALLDALGEQDSQRRIETREALHHLTRDRIEAHFIVAGNR